MTYRDLIVWQKSISLTKKTYEIVKLLPKEELYALSDQMRRAAISVPSNIAEGHSRDTTKDFIRFLSISKGSLSELETQLFLCIEIGYLTNAQITEVLTMIGEIRKMIDSLIIKLRKKL